MSKLSTAFAVSVLFAFVLLVFSFLFLALVLPSLVSATHAVPGGSFNTTNIDFRGSILTNGTDQALTLWVRAWNTTTVAGYPSRFSYLPTYFAFSGRGYIKEFYVMVRNLTAHHPYPALIDLNNVTGALRYSSYVNLIDVCPRGPANYGEWYPTFYRRESAFRTSAIYTVYEPRTFLAPMSIFSSDNYLYAELEDGVPGAFVTGCWTFIPQNKWIITFSKTRYPYALVVENVQYQVAGGEPIDVRGGFISPTGSRLNYYRGLLPTRNVLIEYAYPAR